MTTSADLIQAHANLNRLIQAGYNFAIEFSAISKNKYILRVWVMVENGRWILDMVTDHSTFLEATQAALKHFNVE
jgi:hypothetical protein